MTVTQLIDLEATVFEILILIYLLFGASGGRDKKTVRKIGVFFLIMVAAVYMMTLFDLSAITKCIGVILLTAVINTAYDRKSFKFGTVMGILFMTAVILSDILTISFLRFYKNLNEEQLIDIKFLLILISKLILFIIIFICKRLLNKSIGKINFGNALIVILPNLFNLMFLLLIAYRMYYGGQFAPFEAALMLMAALMLLISTLCNVTASDYYFETKEIEHNRKMNMAQLQMQYEYYKNRREDQIKVRELYHDMKNHLLILQNDLEAQQKEKYIGSMLRDMKGYENYIETGNEFLDCIINEKQKEAVSKGIDFLADIDFSGTDFINPMDICIIFSNALDNAIEACERISDPEQRMITVKAGKVRNFLSIAFENSSNEVIIPENQMIKTSKPDKYGHGFGINNIKKAVEKYQGDYRIKTGRGQFALYLVIPYSV